MAAWFLWTALFLIVSFCCFLLAKEIERWEWIRSSYIVFPHLERMSVHKQKTPSLMLRIQRLCSTRGISFLSLLMTVLCLIAFLVSALTSFSPFKGGLFSSFQEFPSVPVNKTGRINLFIIDCSGSMAEAFGSRDGEKKLKVVQDALIASIKKRDSQGGAGDLIGVNAFARVAMTVVPLMYDREALFDAIKRLHPIQDEKLNGTSTGYALYKTAAQLIATRQLEKKEENKISPRCILISDGIEEPHPLDRKDQFRSLRLIQSLQIAAANGIIVDYIFIGQGLRGISSDEKDRIIKAVQATGGEFREVQFQTALEPTLDDILMKGPVLETYSVPVSVQGREYILFASIFLCIASFHRMMAAILQESGRRRDLSIRAEGE